jgi:hypothetical protein
VFSVCVWGVQACYLETSVEVEGDEWDTSWVVLERANRIDPDEAVRNVEYMM